MFENSAGEPFIFQFLPIFITSVFVIVIVSIIFVTIGGIKQWSKNQKSPRLTVPALITGKRVNVRHDRHGDSSISHRRTSYFVTFEFESNDRIEFHVTGMQYGLLAEGDSGHITFQGTRFLEFKRVSI